uniref:Uncharacterized protein n=1 Tax=Leersia perrieri TaxID=77586 RepID=A0A0D9WDZ2_9ORYZ
MAEGDPSPYVAGEVAVEDINDENPSGEGEVDPRDRPRSITLPLPPSRTAVTTKNQGQPPGVAHGAVASGSTPSKCTRGPRHGAASNPPRFGSPKGALCAAEALQSNPHIDPTVAPNLQQWVKDVAAMVTMAQCHLAHDAHMVSSSSRRTASTMSSAWRRARRAVAASHHPGGAPPPAAVAPNRDNLYPGRDPQLAIEHSREARRTGRAPDSASS